VNIINDFFYLAWESEPVCSVLPIREDDAYQQLLESDRAGLCDALAIVLSLSQRNSEKFLALSEVQIALNLFTEEPHKVWTRSVIYAIQCRLLSFLLYKGDKGLNKAIGQRLDRLRKEGIVGYDTARKLISLLTLIEEKGVEESTVSKAVTADMVREGDTYYPKEMARLERYVSLIAGQLEVPALHSRIERIPQKLREQKFSIGVTGVMNAGKSTMLNALLGAEILGTSVVPETANLTVIKYAKTPKAVVNFWSRKEWNRIQESAQALESIGAFVADTQKHFGSELSSYITADGRSETVTIEQLPQYTSAAHSAHRCNLVKSVELYHDLEFVKGGVEIVDTPGLDDPVIQREEITKGYLLDCDLMCHLMNVGQSATSKDVEFIIDSLLYRNVAQLLIVITRIDTVSAEELSEVIAYTKQSIRARLEALDRGASFEALIEKIVFIPIAAKMALLHRIGDAQEAQEAGYDLESSGILEIEAYLREVLFGAHSPKAKLLIASANKELLSIIHAQIRCYEDEQELLGKSAEEISQASIQYQEEISQTRASIQVLGARIEESRAELERHFVILDKLARSKLQSLQALLKRRIMDDVRYTLRKEKRKPAAQRVTTMIETGMKDGFIDLLREYRYAFEKRVEELLERISREFEGFASQEEREIQDAKGFFEQHFAGLNLSQSNTLLTEQVNQAIAKHSKKQLEQLDTLVEQYFSQAIERFSSVFYERAAVVQQTLLDDFYTRIRRPLERVNSEIQGRETVLLEAKRRAEDGSYDTQKRSVELAEKLQVLRDAQSPILEGGLL
jgi:GTP-binding protein EngB required for normal cell division